MLFKPDTVPNEKYLEDWPKHYFDIEDINMREACLKEYISKHPDASQEKRRLEIFEKRFGKHAKKERGDEFLKCFMMILIAYKNNLNSFNFSRREKELRDNLKKLCVLDFEQDDILFKEWQNLAEIYILTCSSHSYRSTLFGFVTLKDDVVADRMASEIDIVTRLSPKQINIEKECEQLREIFINVYISKLDGGADYWNSYMSSRQDL